MICGNIVEVMHNGIGTLVCCGKNMDLMKEKSGEEGTEKHKPIIEKIETGYKVSIGSVLHPMEEAHYIEWVELEVDGKVYRKDFSPNEKPIAEFCVTGKKVSARAYCNIHGLWKSD